jgi:hypothetical protein
MFTSKHAMAYAALLAIALAVASCSSENAAAKQPPDAGAHADAAAKPSAVAAPASALERPALPRPPQGHLPAELRPPEH